MSGRYIIDSQHFGAPPEEFVQLQLVGDVTREEATRRARAMVLDGEVRLAKVIDLVTKCCIAEYEWRMHTYVRP